MLSGRRQGSLGKPDPHQPRKAKVAESTVHVPPTCHLSGEDSVWAFPLYLSGTLPGILVCSALPPLPLPPSFLQGTL